VACDGLAGGAARQGALGLGSIDEGDVASWGAKAKLMIDRLWPGSR